MQRKKALGVVAVVSTVWLLAGCGGFIGGAAVGGAGAATAYEYQHRDALKQLEQDLEEGRITREEYLERRQAIRERSVVY